MIYPHNFETKIGFDKIRDMVADACISEAGIQIAKKSGPSYVYEIIIRDLSLTEEFRQILLMSEPFPAQDYYDLTTELNSIRLPGTFLDTDILSLLRASLNTLNRITEFFNSIERKEKYPDLADLSEKIFIENDILKELDNILDDKGDIRSGASEKLKDIRKQISKKQAGIGSRINKILIEARKKGWVKDDVDISVRNGRPVIPVPAAHKRRINGWIHDESATGQTVYIEPAEIFETNNEIRELELDERREIVKILIAFANFIRPYILQINDCYKHLGQFDFIRAKAIVALATASIKPIVRRRPVINFRNARHPLLYLSLKKHNRKVVPLTLELSHKERILVISGPNAGGKSICLTTIGLLQYMLQSGMLVSVNENSEFGIFTNILIDIGDEQSLENDLSTYTSHLGNMKVFLRNADRHTLFLIDEFGTGTEPNLGGAIAEATLETLNNQKAWGVITTHYANLKLMSGKHPGIINGAMLFDTREMQPLFMLQTGKPGSSFAFEIARKTGFPEKVLALAALKTGKKQLDFDQQLQQLEIEKNDLTKKQNEVFVADDLLKDLIDRYKEKILVLEKERKEIIGEAKSYADQIIIDANSRIEKTIKEIKEAQAEKEKTKKLRDNLKKEAHKKQINKHTRLKKLNSELKEITDLSEPKIIEPIIITKAIQVNDNVRIKGQKTIGKVKQVKGKKATVEFDNVTVQANISTLEVTKDMPSRNQVRLTRSNTGTIIHDLTNKVADFRITIDVRGQRAEEASANISKYLDDAILINVPEIRIIHGKGTGVLRDVIRELLNATPTVKHFEDENIERGGHGITVVSLRS